MSNEDNKILKNNPEGKSMKTPAIIYADLECLLEKIHSCQNNPENPTQKKNYACAFWVFIIYKLFALLNGAALNGVAFNNKQC